MTIGGKAVATLAARDHTGKAWDAVVFLANLDEWKAAGAPGRHAGDGDLSRELDRVRIGGKPAVVVDASLSNGRIRLVLGGAGVKEIADAIDETHMIQRLDIETGVEP